MQFEEIFEHIGDFGLYQVCVYCIIGMISLLPGMQNLAMTFVGGAQDHWCHVSAVANLSYAQQKHITIPKTVEGQYDSCKMYNLNFSTFSQQELQTWNRSYLVNVSTTSCQEWVYDRSVFVYSVVSEWDLVCGRSWMVQLCSTLWLAGFFFGALGCGFFSDRFGRQRTAMVALTGHIILGFAASFAPNYTTFVVLRFFTSCCLTASFTAAFVICMEMIGPRWRFITGVMYQTWFSLGFMILPGIAYFVRDFRRVQWIMTLPCVFLISCFWLIPESPRWLIVKGKHEKAERILQRIARINRKSLPEILKFDTETKDTTGRKGTLVDIFKSRTLTIRTLIQYLGWFTVSLIYYGLSLNAGTLAGDLFLNTFLLGLVEIPANILCVLAIGKAGRRITVGGSLIIASVTSFVTIPLLYQPSLGWLTTTVSMIGKAASTATFSAIYVYSAELFPTEVRNAGVGSCSSAARISGMASPYVGGPLGNVWKPLPSLVFGAFATLSGALTFILPETLNRVIRKPSRKQKRSAGMLKRGTQEKSAQKLAYDKEQ